MDFRDEAMPQFAPLDAERVSDLMVKYLCGESSALPLNERDKRHLTSFLGRVRESGLSHAQFNELLLLLNQRRVSAAFFDFFFRGPEVALGDLRSCIARFRGFAMLCFGNFRFAYKRLIAQDEKGLDGCLQPFCTRSKVIEDALKQRRPIALDIDRIPREQTCYNGYLVQRELEKEAAFLTCLVQREREKGASALTGRLESGERPSQYEESDLHRLAGRYETIGSQAQEAQDKAVRNTDVYLTWDEIDVYIATSMRHKWEFEETYNFLSEVFEERLGELKLRYFDPTQSHCTNRIDKGLIEGLMLKRASCTIYMAQETDTLGKDSELAATLAQGKPVIAYVPRVNADEYGAKIQSYPLPYFLRRFLILQAEGVTEDETCVRDLETRDPEFRKTISCFLEALSVHRSNQPFSQWREKEDEFKSVFADFQRVCALLAVAEHHGFEKRADTLKKYHPLAVQVHLRTGVANGVLVVRSARECADLLKCVLTNSMQLTVKRQTREEDETSVTVLEETISGSPFRVVTDHPKLTNSFWNFYLTSSGNPL